MLYYGDTSFFTLKLVCYWHEEVFNGLKKEKIVDLTIFVLFSFFGIT